MASTTHAGTGYGGGASAGSYVGSAGGYVAGTYAGQSAGTLALSPSNSIDLATARGQIAAGNTAAGGGLAGLSGGGGLCGGAVCLSGEGLCGTAGAGGSMSYVGSGSGDWITETTYKYVGTGRGNMTITSAEASRPWLYPLAGGVILLVVVLAAVFWPLSGTTTFRAIADDPTPNTQSCLFWGDPHLVTFDNARPSFYGEGEFWIIKNPSVKIQGRYMGTRYTFGLAATQKIAVGGDFIGGHTIEVEPMQREYGGSILVDGTIVCPQLNCNHEVGGARLRYDSEGDLVDLAQSKNPRRVVHLDLPRDIKITVFRWDNYLDLKIEMPPLAEGQDGSCGNYNGDPADDSTKAVFERVGARIEHGQMLFSRRAGVEVTDQMRDMLKSDCETDRMVRGEQECRKALPMDATVPEIDSCVFDMCFGSNEHALRIAKTYATAQQLQDLGLSA